MSDKTKPSPTSINLDDDERAFLDAILSGPLKIKASRHALILALLRAGMRSISDDPSRLYAELGGAPLPAPPTLK